MFQKGKGFTQSYNSECFPGGASGKESACQHRRCKRHGFNPWVGKTPWSSKWHPIPEFLPGRFHGQRSLAGYSPWAAKSQTEHSTHTTSEYSWDSDAIQDRKTGLWGFLGKQGRTVNYVYFYGKRSSQEVGWRMEWPHTSHPTREAQDLPAVPHFSLWSSGEKG